MHNMHKRFFFDNPHTHEKWRGPFVVIYSMFDIIKQVSIQQCGPQLRGVLPPWNHLKYLCTPGQALKRPMAGLSYHSCAAKSPGAWLAGFSAFCWDWDCSHYWLLSLSHTITSMV